MRFRTTFKGTVVEAQLTLKRKARLKNVFMVFQDVHRQLFAEDLEEELRLSDETLTAEEIQHNLETFNIAHQSDTSVSIIWWATAASSCG